VVGVGRGEGEGEQAPEVELVRGGEPQRAVDRRAGGPRVPALVGEQVAGVEDEVRPQRGLRVERAECVLDQAELAEARAPPPTAGGRRSDRFLWIDLGDDQLPAGIPAT